MKATHTDYRHPRHLRVEAEGIVLCMAPSHSQYSRLNRPGLPSFVSGASVERGNSSESAA